MSEIVVIAHDIRSTYNVGSLLRTCDGFGIKTVFCTGYTPYLLTDQETRPPHVRDKTRLAIHKTALGAEDSVQATYKPDIHTLLKHLKDSGFVLAALEQRPGSTLLPGFKLPSKLALILGTETTGLPLDILNAVDVTLEIPMQGVKESFNVSVAAAIALYELQREVIID